MKKIFLTVFLIASITTCSLAQISGGIRTGLNLSYLLIVDDDVISIPGLKPGFILGAYFNGKVSNKLSIQPELVFSTMGTKGKDVDETISMNYLSMPVLLRIDVGKRVSIDIGPQFGLLLSAKKQGVDAKDRYHLFDAGGTIGLGLDFGQFNAGFRYYVGLYNIVDIESPLYIKETSGALQLVLGYRLFGDATN